MGLDDSTGTLVYKEWPIISWIIGLLTLIVGLSILIFNGSIIAALPLFLIAFLVLLAFGSINTITADRFRRLLTISTRSVFSNKVQEFPFSEIANFRVGVSKTYDTRSTLTHQRRNVNYRVVMIKTNGKEVPLQPVFTNGYNSKARKAKALCEYLNLPGWEDKPTNLIQTAMQGQVALTSQPSLSKEGTTSGIRWSIQVHSVGGNPVTRWISADFAKPNDFVLISQKPAGSPAANGGGGFLGSLVMMAYRQVLGLYGFLPGDTPGFDNAATLTTADPVFNQNFYALSSSSALGNAYLNQWTIIPLKNWAERHPFKTINTSDQFGQLAVLYSPRGLQAAVLGSITENQVNELIDLGVELVKSQG